jgi:hypothetical protein
MEWGIHVLEVTLPKAGEVLFVEGIAPFADHLANFDVADTAEFGEAEAPFLVRVTRDLDLLTAFLDRESLTATDDELLHLVDHRAGVRLKVRLIESQPDLAMS